MSNSKTPLWFFLKINKKYLKFIALNSFLYWMWDITLVILTSIFWKIIDQTISSPDIINYILFILFFFSAISFELFFRSWHLVEIYLWSKIPNSIKKYLVDYTMNLDYDYFTQRFSWGISHRVSTISNSYDQLVRLITNKFASALMMVLFVLYCFFSINLILWLLFLLILIFFIAWITPIWLKLNKRTEVYYEEENKTTSLLSDLYANISSVKLFSNKENEEKELYSQIDIETISLKKALNLEVLLFHFQWIFWIIILTWIVVYGYYLYFHSIISIGDLIFLLWTSLRVFNLIREVGPSVASWSKNYWEVKQWLSDILVDSKINDPVNPKTLTNDSIWINFNNISFGYNEWKYILKDFSLEIKPWEKVWIVWASWSWKTTLINLLLRFYDINSWEILLNWVNIKDLKEDYLHSKITHISQDTILFHKTILENIKYSKKDASFEEVEKASIWAFAYEFINLLPEWYNTMVWERWVKLSWWQRQRISIARAILKNSPIFLLDEATSALDSKSEKSIQKSLEKLMEWKTVIAIAHRLSTLLFMDRIFVMDKGQIAESGTHEELLLKKWIYYKLWNMQLGGFIPEVEEE